MSLTHHRWLWLLATVLATASLAATTALASEPDEDDEDDAEIPAQILPATPLPAAPAPAAPAPAAPAPVASAPAVRGIQRTGRRAHRSVPTRQVAHVVRTARRQHTRGIAVRTVPRGGVQAGAGGMAAQLAR